MSTNTTTQTAQLEKKEHSWFESFKRHGYDFQFVLIAVLVTGMYIHLTRLIFGIDLVLIYLATPTFDMLFMWPMVYGVVASLLSWKYVIHRSTRHKIIWGAIIGYFAASIPIHASTYFTHSTQELRFFPARYRVIFLVVVSLMIVFIWRLQLKENQ
jgi:hypothetical protein